MTYALAKELKEAGYPQEGQGAYLNDDGLVYIDVTLFADSPDSAFTYNPTLAELVYACVDGIVLYEDGGFWYAGMYQTGIDAHKGKTPEEAVAKLWLKLNK